MKKIRIHTVVKKELMKCTIRFRDKLSDLLYVISLGDLPKMPRNRPIPSISIGVYELRIKDISGQYRIFYYTKLKNDILVFHFFKKKTQATPKKEIELAKKRLKKMKEYIYEKKSE